MGDRSEIGALTYLAHRAETSAMSASAPDRRAERIIALMMIVSIVLGLADVIAVVLLKGPMRWLLAFLSIPVAGSVLLLARWLVGAKTE
jgi:hypothetical protein